MSEKQKALKEGLARIREENKKIRERREAREKEREEEARKNGGSNLVEWRPSRGLLRQYQPGTKRDVIFSLKMAIPKGRRRR